MATLYTNNQRLIKAVTLALSPVPVEVRLVSVATYPARADCIVTMAEISRETELLALRLRATSTIVLPEGQEWLSERASDGRITVMAGSDLARGDRLF